MSRFPSHWIRCCGDCGQTHGRHFDHCETVASAKRTRELYDRLAKAEGPGGNATEAAIIRATIRQETGGGL